MFGWLLKSIVLILESVRVVLAAAFGENAGKIVDWLAWKVSGAHKIQRVSSSLKGLDKMKKLEECLANSRFENLKKYRDYTQTADLTSAIVSAKEIAPSKDPEFIARMDITFNPICQINKLTEEAISLKRTKYDTSNEDHEMALLSLWNCLQPDHKLDSRISEMWDEVGFQGTDPATDFRGMGILGLENLLYLAKHKKSAARLLAASKHPQYGFSLAITSINLTAVVMELLEAGPLRNHFYQKCCTGGSRTLLITDLHEAHCSVLTQFIDFYQARKPASIMEFNEHKAVFKEALEGRLRGLNPYLKPVP